MSLLFLAVGLLAPAWTGTTQAAGSPAGRSSDDLTQLSMRELLEVEIDTVYAASRRQQRIQKAPSSISIVTADEIKRYGHRTLAEVLRSVRGLYATYDRNYSYLGIRGFNRPGDANTRVLLLINGHRVNDNLYDSASLGTEFPLDIDLIERVEIIRGPTSSLYGSSAFFGVINVITKTANEAPGLEVSTAAGRFGTYQSRLTLGVKSPQGIELLLSGSLYNSDGPERLFFPEFNSRATDRGVATGRDHDQARSIFATASYGDFSVSAAFNSRQKQIPTGSYDTVFNDPRAQTADEAIYADLKYQRRWPDATELMARVAYDRYQYLGDFPYDYLSLGPQYVVVNRDKGLGEWFTGEFVASRPLVHGLTLTLGGEYRNNVTQDQRNFDRDPFRSYLIDRRRSQFVGVYGEVEWSVRTNLSLSAALRLDSYDSWGNALNPRLALIYEPWASSTIKLLYGQAFRAPSAYESYYQAAPNRANPALEPERIRTYELVYEQSLPHELRLSAGAYYYSVENLITQQTITGSDVADPVDDILFFANLDEARARGLELGLEHQDRDALTARVSYSFQQVVDSRTDQRLGNSPQHLAKANFIVPLRKETIFAGLEFQYQSSVQTIRGRRADGFWTANATLFSQKWVKGLEVSASVYNLFDERYAHAGAGEHRQDTIEQDGRTYRLKLAYRF